MAVVETAYPNQYLYAHENNIFEFKEDVPTGELSWAFIVINSSNGVEASLKAIAINNVINVNFRDIFTSIANRSQFDDNLIISPVQTSLQDIVKLTLNVTLHFSDTSAVVSGTFEKFLINGDVKPHQGKLKNELEEKHLASAFFYLESDDSYFQYIEEQKNFKYDLYFHTRGSSILNNTLGVNISFVPDVYFYKQEIIQRGNRRVKLTPTGSTIIVENFYNTICKEKILQVKYFNKLGGFSYCYFLINNVKYEGKSKEMINTVGKNYWEGVGNTREKERESEVIITASCNRGLHYLNNYIDLVESPRVYINTFFVNGFDNFLIVKNDIKININNNDIEVFFEGVVEDLAKTSL